MEKHTGEKSINTPATGWSRLRTAMGLALAATACAGASQPAGSTDKADTCTTSEGDRECLRDAKIRLCVQDHPEFSPQKAEDRCTVWVIEKMQKEEDERRLKMERAEEGKE